MRSLSFISSAPLFEHVGDLMRSTLKQVIWSMLPVWSVLVRCLARSWLTLSSVALVRSLVSSLKRVENSVLVFPTYCLPQVLHCIQYIM